MIKNPRILSFAEEKNFGEEGFGDFWVDRCGILYTTIERYDRTKGMRLPDQNLGLEAE